MKIVHTRGGGMDDEGRKKKPRKVVSSAEAESVDVVKRFDGTARKSSDISVLLESGVVVAIPKQVFRGRIAFQFGKKKNKLILVCAWCGKSLGTAESKVQGVSHGMCQECFDRIIADLPKVEEK